MKVTPLTFKPADGSYIHECGPVVLTKQDESIVEIFTDQGIVGIGPGGGAGVGDCSWLIGRNPFDVGTLGLPAGLDVACWDIIGKAKELDMAMVRADIEKQQAESNNA